MPECNEVEFSACVAGFVLDDGIFYNLSCSAVRDSAVSEVVIGEGEFEGEIVVVHTLETVARSVAIAVSPCLNRCGSGILRMMVAEYRLRTATAEDAVFLFDMLMEAVNWHSERRLARSTVGADPTLARYVDGWPRPNDLGVIAEDANGPIGAVWLRLFTADEPGYGYIADDVPELSIAVAAARRRSGVGRALLREIADRARSAGHQAISLSVERANLAHRLYTREGYRVQERDAASDIMVKELTPNR